jgi:hypothetical protein
MPQLSGSLFRSVQLWPHAVGNGAVQLVVHAPLSQNGEVVPQTFPHWPQLFGSFVSARQEPAQAPVPSGHAQAPMMHDCPEPQA